MPGSTGSRSLSVHFLAPVAVLSATLLLGTQPAHATEPIAADGIIVPFQSVDTGAIYLGDLKRSLDSEDRSAVLRAIVTTLDEVTDGASYVWTRANGRLTGVFQPLRSYRSDAGTTCRHLIVTLTSGAYSKRMEGMACRQREGGWSLG